MSSFARDRRGPDGRLHYLGHPIPDGPWHGEPDRVELRRSGLTCVLDRDDMGSWAGYVAIPVDHPWVASDLDPTLESGSWHDAAHGGIVYCSERSPTSGEVDDTIMWIGFDCAHAAHGDLVPAYAEVRNHGVYRDGAFAIRELCRLADAAHAATSEFATEIATDASTADAAAERATRVEREIAGWRSGGQSARSALHAIERIAAEGLTRFDERAELSRQKRSVVEGSILSRGSAIVCLDSSGPGVKVPAELRNRSTLFLRFGRDLYPPIHDLAMNDLGISGTLHFGGMEYHCTVPWPAIYYAGIEGERGVVWSESAPKGTVDTDDPGEDDLSDELSTELPN